MNKRKLGSFALCAALFALGFPAEAQQPTKIARIGFLSAASAFSMSSRADAFRQGLRERGYVEGTNVLIESRYADGNPDRLRDLVAEIVGLKTEVIISGGPVVTRSLKEKTSTIPIVMTQDSDPVGSGMVVSLARPGGNITGLSSLSPEIAGKRLELLKDTIPKTLPRSCLWNNDATRYCTRIKRSETRCSGAQGAASIPGGQ